MIMPVSFLRISKLFGGSFSKSRLKAIGLLNRPYSVMTDKILIQTEILGTGRSNQQRRTSGGDEVRLPFGSDEMHRTGAGRLPGEVDR